MPQTVEDLGRMVKAKYPQYSDLSDMEVGQKAKQKFPDAYGDFVDTPKLPGMHPAPLPAGLAAPPAGDYSAPQTPAFLHGVTQPVMDALNAGANSGIKHLASAASLIPGSIGNAAANVANEIPEPQSTAENLGSMAENGLELASGAKAGESLAGKIAPKILSRVAPYIGQAAGSAVDAKAQGGNPVLAAAPAVLLPAAAGATKGAARMILNRVLSSPSSERLSNDAILMAQKFGIPLDQGSLTGSRAVQALQKMIGETTAPDKYATLVEGQQSGLNRAANDLSGGGSTQPYEAGQRVIDALKGKIQDLHAQGSAAYDDFERLGNQHQQPVITGSKISSILNAKGQPISTPIMQNMALPVDVSKVKTALKPIYDKVTASLQAVPEMQRQADPGYRLLSRLVTGPNQVSARDAEDLLGLFKSVGRDTQMPELRNRSAGIAALGTKILQPAIDSAVSDISPDAAAALQKGRDLWRQKYAVGDLLDSLGGSADTKQVSAFSKLTAPLDAQYDNLQKTLNAAPGLAEPLRKSFLTKIFAAPTENGGFTRADGAMAAWRKIGPKTKDAVFGSQAKDIDSFLTLARRLNQNPNPSGTGTINALIHLGLAATHPTAAAPLLFTRKLADVLYSPEGAQNLRQLVSSGARSPVGQRAEEALSAWLTGATTPRESPNDQSALAGVQ